MTETVQTQRLVTRPLVTRVTVARMFSGGIKAVLLALFAFVIIGPLANLVLWAFAERWYYPFKPPVTWGVRYWEVVFRPTGVAMASLATSVSIALLTVLVALVLSIPAGYALARLRLPLRGLIMIVFLLQGNRVKKSCGD
jgi:putative spermidine/putrescine transport system permease protein